MLTFIGLGLYESKDVSVKGLELIKKAHHVFIESYTSNLMGTKICEMEEFYGKKVTVLSREDVEEYPEKVINLAKDEEVVLLTGGDPMVSTTHSDLRIRAAQAGVETAIIHGASISSAICGLSGLQNYRFGKSCSLPFPSKGWFPTTPLRTVQQNTDRDLHTLVYLDIQPDRYMTIPHAIEIIEMMSEKTGIQTPNIYIGIARAGSSRPTVMAGNGDKLKKTDFGSPLHILVIPASLHIIEREYLETFAGL